MKRMLNSIAMLLLFAVVLPLNSFAVRYLVPVGKVIGLQLRTDAVTVAAFDDILGAEAKEAGLCVGDTLLEINDKPVCDAREVSQALQGQRQVNVTVQRGSKRKQLTLPVHDTSQGPKLGIYLRQGVAGIGTVTWYDPETGMFGTLGHGVSDHSGALLPMSGGSAYHAGVYAVKKGKTGAPGQLRGEAREQDLCGTLVKNTAQGVFGISGNVWPGEPAPVAEFTDIKTGPAVIRATVDGGEPQEYSVEILKIYPKDRLDSRNFLLRITDAKLLEATGGIVQGMSGSPILQDGKLIGAVTHVLVNNPDTGYGIYIENMLDAAS